LVGSQDVFCFDWPAKDAAELTVCPHRKTVVGSTLSKRNSKQTGQFWCIARSTQTWLPSSFAA
jgi:hypothetical protein